MQIAIIGGGAAGFFAAIKSREFHPDAGVVIFEKSDQVLSKVKVSGGGRCNVTNGCETIPELCSAYPRGGKELRRVFLKFNNKDTIRWFESRGVHLVVQDDLRVFPETGDSQTIINCLVEESKRLGILIRTGITVNGIRQSGEKLELSFAGNEYPQRVFDKVIVATGGSPQRSGLEWLEKLGHKIVDPVPSLFSFNMPAERIKELTGVSAGPVFLKIQGTRLIAEGPLLITHWGMSGPAVLKLSSFAARILNQMDYKCKIQVNWAHDLNNETVFSYLAGMAEQYPNKMLANFRPFGMPVRLWLYLLAKVDLAEKKIWAETGKKGINKLVHILTNDVYQAEGRTTFREEFVTCGGVSLDSVDMSTMQSKAVKNLYFAGEILDIDAITGGFNLQAAWTTGYVCGMQSSEF
ncbi:MAG: NAD(P)/FAD-dependent oxidoreductase [Bacteroidales bacterium]|jgi:hypothetical protein|nr:NAD(P)/FAD-dependent oxidoreductase [Bacteroidales bacterium]